MSVQRTMIVAYVPVIHGGYLAFFRRHAHPLSLPELYLIDRNDLQELPEMRKDIRALEVKDAKNAISALGIFYYVGVAAPEIAASLAISDGWKVVMPSDDVSRFIVEKHFGNYPVVFDTAFLRWDRTQSEAERAVIADRVITMEEWEARFIKSAFTEADLSADWWRQCGAIVVRDETVILAAHNRHVPDELEPYYNGDPRSNYRRGINVELSTALHAEAGIVAEAARRGLSLAGTDLFCTDFPCPPCARVVAYAGFKRLFYGRGYAMLDGLTLLKDKGIEIIQILEK